MIPRPIPSHKADGEKKRGRNEKACSSPCAAHDMCHVIVVESVATSAKCVAVGGSEKAPKTIIEGLGDSATLYG